MKKQSLSNKLKNHFSVRTVSLKTNSHIPYSNSAFTIVELLVVIVVIGILAAITIVSYTGISQKAVLASLQSDLSTSAQKLKMYQVENGTYPASLDNNYCPKDSTGIVDTHYCLKPSPGNNFVYGSSSPYSTFSLTATNDNGISYQVTENSQPTALVPAPLSPVADWLATAQGDHYGNYYDLVSHNWATVTRAGPKTIYDPNDGRIHDVPANYLAMNPWSAYQTGGRGSAGVIEEQRTNYLTNSYGAANDGSKWTAGLVPGGNRTGIPVLSLAQGVYRSTAQRIQYTGVAGDAGGKSVDFAGSPAMVAGETGTFSVYAKGTVTGSATNLRLMAYTTAWAHLGTVSVPITLTSGFVRYSGTYASLPAGTGWLITTVQASAVEGTTIDITIDAAQLEKGAFATSYIPTTTAAVTRNADVVTVPTTGWNAAAGTIVAVCGAAGSGSIGYALSAYNDGNHSVEIGYIDARDYGFAGMANSQYTEASGTTVPRVLALVYAEGNPPAIYQNGTGGVGNNGSTTVVGHTIPETAYIGNWPANGAYNGPIQRITIYSSALSSSDVTTVTNAVKNGP